MAGKPRVAILGGRLPTRTVSPVLRELFADFDATKQTYADFGALVGVHGQTLTKWRTGKHSPSIADVEAMANALGFRLTRIPLTEPAKKGSAE